ncbi:DUF4159 domain-containing protein [Amaricoccus macauensis]|uniref:DUF4159 domain-containing protein n=1 Tax=Amaricoccus macauensis TaxID=57001 RepID=UPI003C7C4703
MSIGSLAFLSPWLLAAILLLPALWFLLRAVPPSALRRVFPGVRLLLELDETERTPARTPWWLLALRMLAIAAVIIAFAEPVLNPRGERGEGPLLVLLDGGWGDAPDWSDRIGRAAGLLTEAERDARPVAVLLLADGPPQGALPLRAAAQGADRLPGLAPRAWSPDLTDWPAWINALDEDFETVWLTDGVGQEGERAVAEALLDHGPVTVVVPEGRVRALSPPWLEQGTLHVGALRIVSEAEEPVSVSAFGPDPNGVERLLGKGEGLFAAGEGQADVEIEMQSELRNRVERIQLDAGRSAAGVVLAGDSVRRREVGLMSGQAGSEAQDLIDPLNYLRKALEPFAETIEAPLPQMLQSTPDLLILADVGSLAETERADLIAWVEDGGMLVRFAGPRLARSGAGQLEADPLLPVRLRAGGRSLGGAMSWGAPRRLRPFADDSPFAGLALPADVEISAQVMAQPDPDLPQRVIASLEDGTPLVTSAPLGDGQVVLFHVTASADWSNLPLSGLFVQMLERLAQSAGGVGETGSEDLAGSVWTPVRVLDGFGDLQTPDLLAGVPGERLAQGEPSRDVPPGFYSSGTRRTTLNVMGPDVRLSPMSPMPQSVTVEGMEREQEVFFGPWLLGLALMLLTIDLLVTLWISGRLSHLGRHPSHVAGVLGVIVLSGVAAMMPAPVAAQETTDEAAALYAANETVLAYVITGNARIDRTSEAGLKGLGQELFDRTAVVPADPVGVDLETDDLSLLPLLYWPVTEAQTPPSDEAYGRLNEYLRHGGMILFDTLDSDLAPNFSGATPNNRALQRIALKLDVPPLMEVPSDHVLTRTFYLLQDFPGRFHSAPVWVEAAPETQAVEGLPFRNLNDGVTPVVIGGNDWASAWAIQDNGAPMYPVGRGLSGERQREMAFRFGVNLVMHVMTGNYKSDQVHVPALLDRLGQ